MNPNTEPVILANSKFSIDLLKELCKGNTDNVLFSPLSISSALGLILLGAGYNSSTANQMYKALHFGNMRIMYHYLFEEIYKEGEYKNQEPKPKPKQEEDHEWKRSLQLVNRLFGEQTVNFYDDFLDYCEEWCFASLRSADFKNNPEAAREKINDWVKNKICYKMNDMLDKGDVSKDTSLALISAVYFKKKWVKSFSPFVTKKGKGVNWPMMGKEDNLPLGTIPHRQHGTENTVARILEIPYENNELQIQKLVDPYENNHLSMIMILPNESDGLLKLVDPYENNHLSMIIILPNESDGLPKLVDSITYEQIMEWTQPDNMILTDVNVEMPSFTLHEKYDLEKALNALGITDLFSDKCDLSGMAPGKLKLSKVVHKSVVEVDEEGTDAEGGGGGVDQIDGNKVSNESFIADRPFLFFIRHNPTKSILFWGRVISPPSPVI